MGIAGNEVSSLVATPRTVPAVIAVYVPTDWLNAYELTCALICQPVQSTISNSVIFFIAKNLFSWKVLNFSQLSNHLANI
jgi:hypothetical protein